MGVYEEQTRFIFCCPDLVKGNRFDCRTEGTQRIPDRNCPGSCAKKKAAAFPGKRYSCLESGSSGVSPRPGGMAARGSTGERAETHEQAAAREKMSCGWTRPSWWTTKRN